MTRLASHCTNKHCRRSITRPAHYDNDEPQWCWPCLGYDKRAAQQIAALTKSIHQGAE